MSTENRIKVFVYGSLKKGYTNHHNMAYRNQHARLVGNARVAGYALCQVEGANFPAVVEGEPEFSVVGEVYQLVAGDAGRDHLRALDSFEGCPTLYRRVAVETTHGLVVWMYVWAGRPDRLVPLATETWKETVRS